MTINITPPEYEYDFDLSHEDVLKETDTDQLKADYLQLDQERLEIQSFIDAYRLAQIDDEPWFKRAAGKLAYMSMASRWVERRILALGETPPYQPTDPRARELRILQEKLGKLNRRVDELEGASNA